MNREIKFRAFCPIQKTMMDPFTLLECVKEDDVKIHAYDDIFMQYTGLKDKNGREIYEGDIVDAPLHCGVGEVLFGVDYSGCFVIKNGNWRYTGAEILGVIDFADIEVIGNKFENPDLLSTPKN